MQDKELRLTAMILRSRANTARRAKRFGASQKVEISPEMALQLADLCEERAAE